MSLLSRGAWIEIAISSQSFGASPRRSSHEERGLKSASSPSSSSFFGRSSHEERGLKSLTAYFALSIVMSLLSRGAWIEISIIGRLSNERRSRSSHEERGLK